MLLQTLRTRDFDQLAQAFPQWDLRFRQLGRGPIRGHLHFLQRRGIQVFQLGVNRMVHIEGWPPPGSYGCFPVLAENAQAVWSGRHLKAGQVRLYRPGQVADHVTAADHYQLVALALDADLVQQEVPVLGGFDPDKRLAGKEVVIASPAYCRNTLAASVICYRMLHEQAA